jgi:hypothetical protein
MSCARTDETRAMRRVRNEGTNQVAVRTPKSNNSGGGDGGEGTDDGGRGGSTRAAAVERWAVAAARSRHASPRLSASIATSITYSARSKRRSCSARCVTAAIVLEMALVACKSSSARGILVGYHSDHCSHSADPASMSFVGDFCRALRQIWASKGSPSARRGPLTLPARAAQTHTFFAQNSLLILGRLA